MFKHLPDRFSGSFKDRRNRRTLARRRRGKFVSRLLRHESLEARHLLTTLFWQGDSTGLWSDPTNWNTAQNGLGLDQAPQAANADVLIFDTSTVGVNNFFSTNDIFGLTDIAIQIVDTAVPDFNLSGNEIVLSPGGITNSTLNDLEASSISMPLRLAAPTTISSSSFNFDLFSTIDNAGHLLTLDSEGPNFFVYSEISGAGGLNKTGSSRVVLDAVNSYGGVTTISDGTLEVTRDQGLGMIAGDTVISGFGRLSFFDVNYASPESVTISSPSSELQGFGATTFTGPITLDSDAFFGKANVASTLTLTGQISGVGGFLEVGGGILTLSNPSNDYGGATGILDTLALGANDVIPDTSDVLLNTIRDSTLDLAGFSDTIASLAGDGGATGGVIGGGTLTVTDSVSPGVASPGILAVTGTLNFPSALFDVELQGTVPRTGHDQLAVTGIVDLTGAVLQPSLGGTYAPAPGDVLTIVDTTAGATGTFAGTAEGDTLLINLIPFEISYAADSGNDVTLSFDQTPALGGTGGADTFTISSDADELVLRNTAGTEILRQTQANLTSLTLDGGDDNDTLVIDLSGGAITVPINFNGQGNLAGSPGDQIMIQGGAGGNNLSFTYTGADSGSIQIDGGPPITYTGLEPITSTITAANVVLTYSAAAETIDVTQSGGDITVDSTLGELTTFTSPTDSLTIHTGGGADVVNVSTLNVALPTGLFIQDGDVVVDDVVNVNGAYTNTSGGLEIDALAINLNADIITDDELVLGNPVEAGTITINTPNITTTGIQLYQDAVELTQSATTLTGDSDVLFFAEVNGGSDVIIDSLASVDFSGTVGGTNPLSSLTVTTNSFPIGVGGDITTSGDQIYNDPFQVAGGPALTMTSSAGAITFNSTLDDAVADLTELTILSTGVTTFAGSVGATRLRSLSLTSAGPLSAPPLVSTLNDIFLSVTDSPGVTDDLLIPAGTTLMSAAGNIVLTGGDSVTLDAASTISAVGGSLALIVDPVAGDADTDGGTATIAGTFNLGAGMSIGGGDDADAFFTGDLGFDYSIDAGDPGAGPDVLNIDGGTVVEIGQSQIDFVFPSSTVGFTGIEEIDVTNANLVRAVGTAGDDTFTVSAVPATSFNTVTFDSGLIVGVNRATTRLVVDGRAANDSLIYDITNGLPDFVEFSGGLTVSPLDQIVIQGANPVASLEFQYISDNDGIIIVDGASIGYTNLAPITSTVTAANVVLSYGGAAETIDVTQSGTDVTVDSTVGEITTFVAPTNALTINTGGGTDAINIEGLTIDLASGFNVSDPDADDTLTFQAAPTTIATGVLGTNTPIVNVNADLSVDGAFQLGAPAAGLISTNATITGAGGIDFLGPVMLTGDTIINASGAAISSLSFNSTVDGAQNLTINDTTSDGTFFSSTVGATVPLASLTTTAGGLGTFVSSLVRTDGNQTYNAPLQVNGPTVSLISESAGALSFASTVELGPAGEALMTNTSGTTSFMGAVGPVTPLIALDVTSGGPFLVTTDVNVTNAFVITVPDSAGTGDDVTITSPANITSSLGNVNISAGDSVDIQAGASISVPQGIVDVMADQSSADAAGASVFANAAITTLGGVFLRGGNDADTFSITPQSGTTFQLEGNDPTTSPGDAFDLNAAGGDVTIDADTGAITLAGGSLPFTLSGIEDLRLSNIAVLTIAGTAGVENVSIAADPNVAGGDLLTINGGVPIGISAVAALVVNADNSDDIFTFDANAGMPTTPVTFNGQDQDGGSGGDQLRILGTFTTQTLNYTLAGGDGNSGSVELDGTATINYTGLEPIDAGNSADTILSFATGVVNDPILQDNVAAGLIEIVGATFEDTVIPNPTNSLTINLDTQGDTLNVTTLDAAYTASLIINGGASASDTVQLTNVDLINTPGRGLHVTGTEMVGIIGGTISGNTARIGGGILINNSANGTTAFIDGTTISGNTANGNLIGEGGGGIFNNGAVLNISSTTAATISNNVSNRDGGGIYNNGNLDVAPGTMITGNSASFFGGGIYNAPNAVMVVNGATIASNSADDGGGILNDVLGDATVLSSTITANTATLDGGGIHNNGGTLLVDNSAVSNNTAGSDGGGVLAAGTVTIQAGSMVTGNSATNTGGGIFHADGTLVVDNTTVQSNVTANDGGGLFLSGGTATITDTSIDSNTASGDAATNGGGGIFVNDNVDLTLGNSVVINSNAADGTLGSGGGIFVDTGATLSVDGTGIAGNTAQRAGGGIEDNSGAGLGVTLNNVNLSLNAALGTDVTAPGNGGGLHVTGAGDVSIAGGFIEFNTAAEEGGGLWNGTGTMTVDGTVINANIALGAFLDQAGGGMFNNGGTVNLDSVQLTDNIANTPDGSGGGGFSDGGTFNVSSSTVTGNNLHGIVYNNASGTLSGNTFSGNVGEVVDPIATTDADDSIVVTATSITLDGNTVTFDSTIGPITIDGSGGDDTLTIDLSNGPMLVPIHFNGQSNVSTQPGDQIVIQGGAGVTDLVLNYANVSDGSVQIDGGPLITYTGLEPITSTVTANNVTLNYSAVAETITAIDAGGGSTTVDSTSGEMTTFVNPTDSLTINTGGGADTVVIDGVSLALAGALSISDPSADDAVSFANTPSSITNGAVFVSAPTINVSADVSADGGFFVGSNSGTGSITLAAAISGGGQEYSEPVTLAGSTTLASSDGIDFLFELDGASDLILNAVADGVRFLADVGSTIPLASLTVAPGGVRTLISGDVLTTGSQSFGAPILTNGGGTVINIVSDAGTLAFGSTIDNASTPADTLLTDSDGATTFAGVIGGANPLTSLDVNPAEDLVFANDITVLANIIVTISDFGNLSIQGPAVLTTGVTNSVSLDIADNIDIQAGATINTATLDVIADPPATDQDPGTGSTILVNGTVNVTNATNVTGGGDADSISITPQAGTSFVVDGGDPTTSPGDSLNIDAGGVDVSIDAGSGAITIVGSQPVTANNIEDLSLSNVATLTIVGDVGPDAVTVAADPSVAGGDLLSINGMPIAISSVTSLVYNGSTGDDVLTFDATNGLPTTPVTFNGEDQDGASGGDRITVVGSFTTQTLNYTAPGIDGNNGNVDVDGTVITYTGLEPIDAGDSTDTILNFNTGLSNNATLQDNIAGGSIEIIDNGATFEDTVIPNPTNSLTVNLDDQGDTLSVLALDAAYAASLIINGGASAGDIVQLNGVNLDTAGSGRGLTVSEIETLDITGSTISNNTALIGGGILIDNSTAGTTTTTIDGTTISGNSATGGTAPTDGGGGVYNRGGGVLNIINGTVITANSAVTGGASGGGILSDGTLSVQNSTISNNDANRAGGGIEIAAGSGLTTLASATLSNNTAMMGPGNGGGLHITGAGDALITDGSVTGNVAGEEGGGLWNSTGTMTIDGTTISDNTANAGSNAGNDQGGGGVFNNGGTLDIDNAAITGNFANLNLGNGAGVMTVGGSVTIGGTTIMGNEAARAGGGIENNDGLVTLTNTTVGGALPVDGNTAGINGGGLHVSGAGMTTVNGGLFQNNIAQREGGGLWNNTGTMTIQGGVVVDSNTASGDAADDGGGGIFNNGGTLIISDVATTISANTADGSSGSGGGIFNSTGGTVTVTDAGVDSNVANRAGGGIEDASGTGLGITLNNVTITNNNAGVTPAVGAPGNGGGLHVTGAGDVLVDGGEISGNSAALEGGGLWNGTGTLTIQNGALIDANTASGDAIDDGGGGIFNNGGTLNISGATTTISNNSATGADGRGGGIFNNTGATLSITDAVVTLNFANAGGGGIEDASGVGVGVALTGASLTNNSAGASVNADGGGGLHVTAGGDVVIDATQVQGNSSAIAGGGLFNDAGTMTIQNGSIVENNTATGDGNDDGGGGIYNDGGTVVITGATTFIRDNEADGLSGRGGGIYSTSDGSVSITDAMVTTNSATIDGGGLFADGNGGTVNLNGATFDANVSGDSGGGALIDGPTTTITSSVFSGNTAQGNAGLDGDGGGLFLGGDAATGTFTITDSMFNMNTAFGGGGGAFILNVDGTISGGTISTNTVNGNGTTFDTGGGGLGIIGEVRVNSVDITGITVDSNTAPSAAGVGIVDALVTIAGSVIINNTATEALSGGGGIGVLATVVLGSDALTITGSNISSNLTAGEGGGIGVINADISVTDTVIDINQATGGSGGGIGLLNNGIAGTATIRSTTISSNTAAVDGGGIAVLNMGLDIANGTISANDAGTVGGGIAYDNNVDTVTKSVSFSTISSNTAAGGGANVSATGSPIDVIGSIFNDGNIAAPAGVLNSLGNNLDSGNTSGFAAAGDLLNSDPLLGPLQDNGGPVFTHALLSGSAAIDAGPAAGPATDARAVARPQDGDGNGTLLFDIGAFEGESPFVLLIDDVTVDEGALTATITVRLSADVVGGFTVDFATSDGTANQPDDYAAASNTLTFVGTAGEMQSFTVTIIDDVIVEPGETINVALSNVSNVGVDITDTAILTIIDNDTSTLTVNGFSVAEDAGTATVTITSSNAVAGGFTVDFATSDGTATEPGDYTAAANILAFVGVAGEMQSFTVSIIDDVIVEPDETINISLSNASNAMVDSTDTAIATIIDNDTATLAVDDVTVNEDGGTAIVTVTVDNAVSGGFAVDIATSDGTSTAPDDYTASAATLTFTGTAGEFQTVAIPIVDDAVVELLESLAVTLANPSNASVDVTDTALVNINDNDIATLTVSDVTVNEDAGTATVTVTVDNAVQDGFTVDVATADGTATQPNDYTSVLGSLSFVGNVGESQTFNVPIIDDAVTELTETINVSLSNPSLAAVDASDNAVINITDNDAVVIIAADATLSFAEDGPAQNLDLATLVTVNGSPLSPAFSIVEPTRGITSFNGSVVSYTPDPDDFSTSPLTLTYTASIGSVSDSGTVFINIAAVNDRPVPADDQISAAAGSVVQFSTADLLANDSPGAPNETADILTIQFEDQFGVPVAGNVIETDRGGTITVNGTQLTYTPPQNLVTNDSFRYRITDNGGLTSNTIALVTMAIDGELGDLNGHVFCDLDRDANNDAGEAVSGTLVFVDANNNGRFDSGELNTTTDMDGFYEFNDLTGTDLNVTAVIPSSCNTIPENPAVLRTEIPVGNLARSIISVDIDGDLDRDLVIASDMDNSLTVLENTPNGFQLGSPILLTDSTAPVRPQSVFGFEQSGIGSPTVTLAVAAIGTPASGGAVYKIENLGVPVEHLASDGPVAVIVDDFEGDTVADVLSASLRDNALRMHWGGSDEIVTIETLSQQILSIASGNLIAPESTRQFVVSGFGYGSTTKLEVFSVSNSRSISKVASIDSAPSTVQVAVENVIANQTNFVDEIVQLRSSGKIVVYPMVGGSIGAGIETDVQPGASSFAFGDFNRDGRTDVAVANLGGQFIELFTGTGDGRFALVTTVDSVSAPSDLVVDDFNDDGFDDIGVANLYTDANVGEPSLPREFSFPSTVTIMQLEIASGIVNVMSQTVATEDIVLPLADPDVILDTSGDNRVTALDALRVINVMERQSQTEGEQILRERAATDVNGDGRTSAVDALMIINYLSRDAAHEGELVNIDDAISDNDEDDGVDFLVALDLALMQGLY